MKSSVFLWLVMIVLICLSMKAFKPEVSRIGELRGRRKGWRSGGGRAPSVCCVEDILIGGEGV